MTEEEMRIALKSIQTKELNDEERTKLPGSFVRLSSGVTHYEVKGDGMPVVLVHGYATPYYIYDKLFDAMVEKGYRVLRYDLLGRGFSERINAVYDAELFVTQLYELTQAVFKNSPFYLVGTSMGGTICTAFFKHHPEKVLKLALLAPAGMDTFKPPVYMKLCRIEGIGEVIFYNVAGKLLLKKCASELYLCSKDEIDYYQRNFLQAMQYKGFLKATLSSLRNTILRTDVAMEGYRAVAKYNLPLLCIWGTADKTMPYYQHKRLIEVCPNAKLITYENAGHVFLFDQGEQTATDVLDFFGRKWYAENYCFRFRSRRHRRGGKNGKGGFRRHCSRKKCKRHTRTRLGRPIHF